MNTTETTREVAERRLREEQEETRRERLTTLESEEVSRREREKREREAEAARQKARDRAAELADERRELEDRADGELEVLRATLDELLALDREHRAALQATGKQVYEPALTGALDRWSSGLLPGSHNSRRERLRDLDRLSPE